jgi:hypothetical protein
MRTVRLLGFTVAVVVGSIASASTAPRAVLLPDACALLTSAQIAGVLGFNATGGPMVPGHSEICVWAAATDPMHKGKHASLSFLVPLGSRTPKLRFETGKTPVSGVPKAPVSGIGDDAYYTTLSGLGTTLSVLKGETAFQIIVAGFADADVKAKEQTLALQVLGKL